MHIDFAFVVLVYRNYLDLDDFCVSIKKNVDGKYKIVVVDAFYNEETSLQISKMATNNNCDYIRIDNNGYGYGNNKGIEYVNANYDYEWICVCNPDTVLQTELSVELLNKDKGCIVAPLICAKTGKKQNPYWAWENKIAELIIYCGYLYDSKLLMYVGVAANKLLRGVFRIFNALSKNSYRKIYACHGSFVLLPECFARSFRYDEEMFLFYEEAYLAYIAKKKAIKTVFNKYIHIFHKEDGSMNIAQIKEYPHLRNSYLHYYSTCRGGNAVPYDN